MSSRARAIKRDAAIARQQAAYAAKCAENVRLRRMVASALVQTNMRRANVDTIGYRQTVALDTPLHRSEGGRYGATRTLSMSADTRTPQYASTAEMAPRLFMVREETDANTDAW